MGGIYFASSLFLFFLKFLPSSTIDQSRPVYISEWTKCLDIVSPKNICDHLQLRSATATTVSRSTRTEPHNCFWLQQIHTSRCRCWSIRSDKSRLLGNIPFSGYVSCVRHNNVAISQPSYLGTRPRVSSPSIVGKRVYHSSPETISLEQI